MQILVFVINSLDDKINQRLHNFRRPFQNSSKRLMIYVMLHAQIVNKEHWTKLLKNYVEQESRWVLLQMCKVNKTKSNSKQKKQTKCHRSTTHCNLNFTRRSIQVNFNNNLEDLSKEERVVS